MALPERSHTTWMFQYNPFDYKLEKEVQSQLTEEWNMYWGRSLVQLGERVYFMRSGGDRRAITAVGRIVSQLRENQDEPDRFQRYKVDVVYDYLVKEPLTWPEMREHAVLRDYAPYAIGVRRTNFPLPVEVAALTEQLVRLRLRRLELATTAGQRLIFISHSHLDDSFGLQLANDLRQAFKGGPDTVWYDSSGGLQGGDEWWDKIRLQIEQRPIFLVVLSPASMDSVYVNREISMAMVQDPQRIRIVPVLHQPCNIRGDLKPIQYISFAAPNTYEQGLEELLGALGLER